MTEEQADAESMRGRSVALWAGVIGAPAVWAAQLEINYALAPSACKPGVVGTMHLVTAVCVALALLGALLSWRDWKRAGGGSADETDGGPVARDRFLGVLGLLLSVLSAVVILAQGIATAYFDACWS